MAKKRTPAPLKRRKHVAEPERRFYVYCEGVKTEPEYLRAVRHRFKRASIEVVGVGGVALTVADRAIQQAKELRSNRGRRRQDTSSYEEQDQVWAVFDRDDHPQFDDAVAICRSNRVEVAQSDPCFEVWLVLHLEDYDKPASSSDIQARLHKLLPEYHHEQSSSPNFETLLVQVRAAERRAARQLRAREAENRPFGNPSTTVGCLTRTIREAHELTQQRHTQSESRTLGQAP